ncbi:MAG TPA: VWA domain-containing protein [Thermoanaerobaculia bacterium]|nr:VWA domain-containing protein [Thermoanaerobaculia bacterium]
MNILRRTSLFVFTFAIAALPLISQETETPTAQFEESLEVRLYNLDAIVTTKDGKPVRGLTKDDFIVLENNVPQPITNFSFYDIGSSTMALSSGNELVSTPTQTTIAEAPPARRFVFFIDEMAIQGQGRKNLKKQAATLISAMRPGDLATVVRPTSTAQMEQLFTSDPAEVTKWLNKAIDSCKVRLTSPAFAELRRFRQAMETAESPSEIALAKKTYTDQQRTRVEQRVAQLRALIAGLAATDEKKVLVLITSGLNAQPGREVYSTEEQLMMTEMHKVKGHEELMNEHVPTGLVEMRDPSNPSDMGGLRGIAVGKITMKAFNQKNGWDGTNRPGINDLQTQIDDLGRTAAANRIVIYALTPEIPMFLESGRGADARTLTTQSTVMGDNVHLIARDVVPAEMLNQLLEYEGQTLQSFAEKTGGRWFRGTGVVDDTFRTLNDDLQVYYSIAYRGHGDAKKARKVAVKVKNRPELKVRTRSEVSDSDSGDMASRVIAGLLYPLQKDELKMAVKAETPQKDGKKYNVPLEVVIPIDKMTFLLASDGTYKARVTVHYAAAAEKEFVSYGRQEQMIELTPHQYREMLRIRYRYTSNITVPKGKIRIALGVVDSTSKMSSLQTVNLSAP